MLIKDISADKFKTLIRQTLEETLAEFFAAFDETQEVRAEIKEQLIQLQKRRETNIRDIPFLT